MNKSNIEVPSAGTTVDSNSTADIQQVSQPNANTNVVGTPFQSREIKFRLHDKEGKIIGYETHSQNEFGCWQIYQSSLRGDWNNGNENKLVSEGYFIAATYKVQYTGLKDIKDKEIYEGDKTIRGYVIMWSKKHGLFCEHFYQKFFNEWSEASYPMFAEGIEIIGNVFENPELLQTLR